MPCSFLQCEDVVICVHSALGVLRRFTVMQTNNATTRSEFIGLKYQAVRSTENCRVLCTDNAELRQELDRVKGLLDNAKKGGLKATARIDELRLKEIEAGLLTDELEAVRGDCGRLVQLVRYTVKGWTSGRIYFIYMHTSKCHLQYASFLLFVKVQTISLRCTLSIFSFTHPRDSR